MVDPYFNKKKKPKNNAGFFWKNAPMGTGQGRVGATIRSSVLRGIAVYTAVGSCSTSEGSCELG